MKKLVFAFLTVLFGLRAYIGAQTAKNVNYYPHDIIDNNKVEVTYVVIDRNEVEVKEGPTSFSKVSFTAKRGDKFIMRGHILGYYLVQTSETTIDYVFDGYAVTKKVIVSLDK